MKTDWHSNLIFQMVNIVLPVRNLIRVDHIEAFIHFHVENIRVMVWKWNMGNWLWINAL